MEKVQEQNTVRVVAWVSPSMAAKLDAVRRGANLSRSATVRHLVNGTMPRAVPSVNLQTSKILARGFGNLALIAKRFAEHGLPIAEVNEIKTLLAEVRTLLLTAKLEQQDTEE